MTMLNSDCKTFLEYSDFDPARLGVASPRLCPVRNCETTLIPVPYGKKQALWCPTHGIRLHSDTFVYWNGPDRKKEAILRNFVVRKDLVKSIALVPGAKSESYRLGSEMSEDALTWNVFVSLAEVDGLRAAAEYLTGRPVISEPDLYLWGQRIELKSDVRGEYAALVRVREGLEKEIRRFRTEPDIMLVADGEMVICIEAKFGSGNTLAHGGSEDDKEGEKPTSRQGLLTRYLGPRTSLRTRNVIKQENIGSVLHSQLFRNIVFAAEMAGSVPWHVVNLVSTTQRPTRAKCTHSFDDPTHTIQDYLDPAYKHCFTRRTWESLYTERIRDREDVVPLGRYLRAKSAHFIAAFDLN